MKVSYNWLKDYVDITLEPEKLAHILTMAGLNVASCRNEEGDYILEFEITANRSDCLSIIGIARECAAILGKKLKVPKELTHPKRKIKAALPLSITLKDTELCFRYTARVIKNTEIKPSPDWIKERIISVGLRPINNIVDITNFVLLETGQPMHAFDLDKIKGDVSVRRAKSEEKIITIDNEQQVLTDDMLVIADDAGPIAIAGVMGGLETEVNDLTKNILLESAFFNPVSVRRTSRALGLSSESSYRFERRIDNCLVERASDRAAGLIKIVAGGETSGLIDLGSKKGFSKIINFDMEKTDAILGAAIGEKKAVNILKSLGFGVNGKKGSLKITVPGFRGDVKTDMDLAEEVARIHGYENIPLTIPHIVGNVKIKDSGTLFQEKISRILARLGLCEIITYSLISRNSVKNLGVSEDEIITIQNPLSIDQEIMRPSMLPGMLACISHNLNRKARRLSLFEIGKIYKEKKSSYIEEPVISIGLAGIKEENWKIGKEEFNFFDLKGTCEKLLSELSVTGFVFKKSGIPALGENTASVIEYKGEVIAVLGEVGDKISKQFAVDKKVFYAEIYPKNITGQARLERKYAPLSRYPSIIRDISIVLDKRIASSRVLDIIKDLGKKLVKDVSLIDCYKGKQIPEDKHGFLYRIEYRSDERTLEDAEVESLHSAVKSALSENLGASFR